MFDFEEELKMTFLNEADEAIQEAERIIISLERDADKSSAIVELFRVMHNFKGSASGVGLTELAQITHAAESFLMKLKSKEMTLTPEAIGLFLRCNDHLVASVARLREDLKADVGNPLLMAELEKMMQGGGDPVISSEKHEESEVEEMRSRLFIGKNRKGFNFFCQNFFLDNSTEREVTLQNRV